MHSNIANVLFEGSYSGYGVDHSVGDLILPHVFHHVELSRPLLGDDLVGDFLQLRVELFKQIFKQQRQELRKEIDDNTSSSSSSAQHNRLVKSPK